MIPPTKSPVPAPALARGIEVLRLLDRKAELTLEQVAGFLPAYPKPSIFRILQTLAASGLVEKSPELRYRALQVLRPARTSRPDFAQRLAEIMTDLVEETGCTVEWFESTEEGMALRRQIHPRTEVRVHARPGFVRTWNSELDSVALMGYAFSPQAPQPADLGAYVKNGILGKPTSKEIRERITRARQKRSATDPAFNRNGVRRSSAGVFCPEWCGVLTLAQAYLFGGRTAVPAALEKRLRDAAEVLQQTNNPL